MPMSQQNRCSERTTLLPRHGETIPERLASFAAEAPDRLALTGGAAAGGTAHHIVQRRLLPLQAELGGNNAAVVWSDTDLEAAARQIFLAAFGFPGQRCTANRRVIVARPKFEAFLGSPRAASAALAWGDTRGESTEVGPLISAESRDRVVLVMETARQASHRPFAPHVDAGIQPPHGWYPPPTIAVCDNPEADLVQLETFAPVLVVQPADSWDDAVGLANGVVQGLVAAVFTASEQRWNAF